MSQKRPELFTAPWLLATAFLLVGVAIVEKALNLVGLSIPVTQVYPRLLLEWAVTLLIFDIALTLRQMLETSLARGGK